ncbi:MAG TPA: fibronectin type III domain-containing protein, partial [Elusimicrobiota bacterium]|nr:fibronectin type III domain-containing protein [Elusimicrobiota bacterium]
MAVPFAEGGRAPRAAAWLRGTRLLTLSLSAAILYQSEARAATLAPNYPQTQNVLIGGSVGGQEHGFAAALDPQTLQLWAAGSGYDSNAGAPTGAVVLLDGKGNISTSIGLRLGAFGSSCSVGSFNYCAQGSSSTVKALALDSANRRLWAAGTQYDATGANPVLFVAAIDLNTSNVVSFLTETSTGTQARGAGVSADGSAWIAGVSNGAAFLWNADVSAGLQEWENLSQGGEANAVAEDSSGAVWVAGRSGDTGEFALWDDDDNSGTIFEYDWENTLGGSGSSGRALALAPGGVVAVAGRASAGARSAAVVWTLSDGDFSAAASGGAYDEAASGLALDDGGNAWATGTSGVDGSGDRQFALWELPQLADSLTLSATYVDSSYNQTPYADEGAAAVYSQGSVWSVGTLDDSTFAAWNYVLNTGNIYGSLQYAGGFSGHNFGYFVSATPTFNSNPIGIMGAAPSDGTTSYSFVLTSLAAPATYYLAAVYDLTDGLGGKGVPAGDPIGLYQDDADGNVTSIAPIFVPAGGAANGVNVTAALDTTAPSPAIAAPIAGSTFPASAFALSGTATDNTSVVNVALGMYDATAGLWWSGGSFSAPTGPQFALKANETGPVNSVAWSAAPNDAAAVTAALQPGHQYVASVQAQDLVGNAATVTSAFVIASTSPAIGSSNGRGLARGPDGSFWVAADDGGPVRVERYNSGGAFVSSTTLPGSSAQDAYSFAFDSSGDVWSVGAAASGFGIWKLDPAGDTVLSSTQVTPSANCQLSAGKLAVDASGNAWVPATEIMSSTFTFKLYEFTPGAALATGFPKKYQRGGGLDGAISTVVDGSGNVWTAGASSNPASGKIDFALWEHDSSGNLQSGFPVFWGDAFQNTNNVGAAMVLSSNRLWVATEKGFDACANPDFALAQYDLNGVQISSSLWHDAADTGSLGRGLTADGSGNLWAVGQLAGAPELWKYGMNGALASGYPKSFTAGNFDTRSIAADAANSPWVLNANTPTLFNPGVTTAGAAGPSACALAGTAQVSGVITNPVGFTAGGTLTLAVSMSPILGGKPGPTFYTFTTSTGTTYSYTLTLAAPAAYYLIAIGAAVSKSVPPGAGIADYDGFAPVTTAAGVPVANVNATLAPDDTPPASGISSIPNGSTVTVLSSIAGTATDNVGVGQVALAVHDLTFDLWWNAGSQQWFGSTTPYLQSINPIYSSGNSAAESWRESVSPNYAGENFGALNGYLAKGHAYQVISQATDIVGNVETPSAGVVFYWNGAAGSLPPGPPQNVQGSALGLSSIAWSWSASQGVSSYNVYLGTSVFLGSTTQTNYLTVGLSTNAPASLCVSGVNQFGAGAQACAPNAYTLGATPGQPFFTAASSSTLSLSWDAMGNPFYTSYEVVLSTNGFATQFVVTNTNQISAVLAGLTPATAFSAEVLAINGNGVASSFSPSASTTTALGPPQAPTNLTATGDQPDKGVDLSWQAASGGNPAASYDVYRGVSPDTSTFDLPFGTTSTAYVDRPTQSATYYYQVAGVDSQGDIGPRSAVASAAIDLFPPQIVTDLRIAAVRLGQGQLDLAWTATSDDFSGVQGYRLFESTTPAFSAGVSSFSIAAVAPGSTATYTVTISSLQAVYFELESQDFAGNVSSPSNVVLFDPVPPVISSFSLVSGGALSRPLTVTLQASDNVSVAQIVFSVDGASVAALGPSQMMYSFFWDTRLLADGVHTLTATAFDTYGNQTSVSASETINYAPPAPPVITFPAANFTTRVATIDVTGTAEPGTTVQLLVNDVDLDTAASNGAWSIIPETLPLPGVLSLTAVAFETRGFSQPSAAVAGIFANQAPLSPELPTSAPQAGGAALISWSAPSAGVTPATYNVYRSTDDTLLQEGTSPDASLLLATGVTQLQYTDLPAVDDLYFYGVTALDAVGNESPLSDVVYALTDRVPPMAQVVFATAQPVSIGVYQPSFVISEVLSTP